MIASLNSDAAIGLLRPIGRISLDFTYYEHHEGLLFIGTSAEVKVLRIRAKLQK